MFLFPHGYLGKNCQNVPSSAKTFIMLTIFNSERLYMSRMAKGIIAAVVSNILFGSLFMFGPWMRPMSGTDVFAWRIVGTFTCALSIMLLTSAKHDAARFLSEIGGNLRRWALVLLPAPIMIGQIWLYMWAPVNGKGVDVSMGYFLFPLAMMLGGVMVFRERLDRLQLIAVLLASAAVALEIWNSGTFSWVTIAVFATFPIYYIMRRWQGVPPLLGLLLDLILALPFVIWYLVMYSPSPAMIEAKPILLLFAVLLGLNGAVSMQVNLTANELLPVVLFGMLSYLEPALLFLLSVFVLGEHLDWVAMVSHSLIWASIIVMLYHGIQTMRREKAEQAA